MLFVAVCARSHRKDDITVITHKRINAPIFINLVITLTSNYDREHAVLSLTVKLYAVDNAYITDVHLDTLHQVRDKLAVVFRR